MRSASNERWVGGTLARQAGWLLLAILFLPPRPALADFICSRCGVLVVTGGAGALRGSHSLLCGKCGKVDCEKEAAKLRAEYQDARRRSREYHEKADYYAKRITEMRPGPYRDAEARRAANYSRLAEAADQDIASVRQRWAALRYICPRIGNLDPNEADIPPASPDFKSDNGKRSLQHQAASMKLAADRLEDDIDDLSAWLALLPAPSIEAAVGLPGGEIGGGAQWDAADIVTQWSTKHKKKVLRDFQRMADEINKLADDPPSEKYQLVEEPAFDRSIRNRADDKAEVLDAASVSLQRNAGFIAAYRVAFERYQGAKKAGDAKAMSAQAGAMARFALHGRVDGQLAAEKLRDFRLRVLAGGERHLARLAKGGGEWEKELPKAQQVLKEQGWSSAQKERLAKLGYAEADLQRLKDRSLALNPDSMKDGLEVARVVLRGPATRPGEKEEKPGAAVPPHANALDVMWYFAQAILQELEKPK